MHPCTHVTPSDKVQEARRQPRAPVRLPWPLQPQRHPFFSGLYSLPSDRTGTHPGASWRWRTLRRAGQHTSSCVVPMWRPDRGRNSGGRLEPGIPGTESPSHRPGYPSVEGTGGHLTSRKGARLSGITAGQLVKCELLQPRRPVLACQSGPARRSDMESLVLSPAD